MIRIFQHNKRLRLLTTTAVVTLTLAAFAFPKQQSGQIILHDEPFSFKPNEFYIADVTDERTDRGAIAQLLPFPAANGDTKTIPVDFNGGFGAVSHFFKNNLAHDTALRPVVIRLTKFMVNEVKAANGQSQGKAVLQLSFDIMQGDVQQHLIDYNGTVEYMRSPGPPQDIEPTLRKMLAGGLDYFNNWINKYAASDVRLAKSVKLYFTDYAGADEDTIYYSANRPLTWDDFRGTIPQSRYDAEVSPTIGYNETAEVKNTVINVHIQLKVSLAKSACWVKEGARNDYTLNHEQRHFDLAKIALMHFKQKIRSENLPPANFDGPINVDYLDAYRQMDTLEMRYDNETQHGTDHNAQEHWNETIDKELKEWGVK